MNVKDMIHYEVSEHIAEIRIDHPPVNGLNIALIDGIIVALNRAAVDDEVRAVLITSAVPRRFCAGLDLDALLTDESGTEIHRVVEKLYVGLSDAQSALGKPSIAVVNGAARGGGMTLAISCDVLIAGKSASFGYPEIDVGMIPPIHFVQLPRVVGRHRAFEFLFTGRSFGAAAIGGLRAAEARCPHAPARIIGLRQRRFREHRKGVARRAALCRRCVRVGVGESHRARRSTAATGSKGVRHRSHELRRRAQRDLLRSRRGLAGGLRRGAHLADHLPRR
jgi:enoyl-CoA hydratase/carnithine racemase